MKSFEVPDLKILCYRPRRVLDDQKDRYSLIVQLFQVHHLRMFILSFILSIV